MAINIKTSFGPPAGSSYAQLKQRQEFLNNTLYTKDFYKQTRKLTEHMINMLLIKELCGTYQFQTENEYLLKNENLAWWTLFFYGRVGFIKQEDKIAIVRILNFEYDAFGDLTGNVKCVPAKILFDFTKTEDDVNEDEILEIPAEYINVLILDNNFATFWERYGWVSEEFIAIWNQYLNSLILKNKTMLLKVGTKQQKILEQFEADLLNPEKLWVCLYSPKVLANLETDASVAGEKPVEVQEINKNFAGVEIEDVLKFWKSTRDMLGFNASSSVKKERLISTEAEEAENNTNLMAEVEMRNFRTLERDFKSKFNIELKILKTMEVNNLQREENANSSNEQIEGDNQNDDEQTE